MKQFSTYALVNKQTGEPVYVGLTSNPKARLSCHTSRCNNAWDPKHNLRVYKHIRAYGGMDNFEMAVLSTHNVHQEGRNKEVQLIEQLQPSGNTNLS